MADAYIDTYVDTYDDQQATSGSGGGSTDAYSDTYYDTYGSGSGSSSGGGGGGGGGDETPPNPELTIVSLYHPEIIYDVPPLEPTVPRLGDRLFRFYSSRPRGQNVWLIRQNQSVPFIFGTMYDITLTATKRQPQPTTDEAFVARGNTEFGPAGYVRLLEGGSGTHALNLEEHLAVSTAINQGLIGGTVEILN